MAKFRVEGLDKLQKKLRANVTKADVKKVIQHNAGRLVTQEQMHANFTRGYQTGTTKRSIAAASPVYLDNGFTAEVGATTLYAPYLEYGTRFMTAQPFIRPAFNIVKAQFKSDMQRLTK